MTKNDTDIEHSERGPSTAHRWRPCPGSVLKSRGLPDEAGIEAALGTVFHEVAAHCLDLGVHPDGFIGIDYEIKPHGIIPFDQEMANNMLVGLDYFRSFMTPTSRFFVEKRVSLERWIGPNEFGTADAFALDLEWGHIFGGDWKYGAGVPVSPVENDQAILYLLGVWDAYGEEMFGSPKGIDVTICIEQPRAPGGGGVWETNMEHLIEVGHEIRRDADLTMDPNAPIVPGEKQCKFCKAARYNTCKERIQHFMEAAGVDFDAIDDAPVWQPLEVKRALTPEQRTRAINSRGQIISILDSLQEEALSDLKNGRPCPGKKLAKGRRPGRKWKSDVKAKAVLSHRLGSIAAHKPPQLISPTDLENLVGKETYREHYSHHVEIGEPKSVMVDEDDPREAFPDVTDDYPEPDDADNLV
jgi:hypothetical protein